MNRPLILVTNDDGAGSRALAALAIALEVIGEIWVCAPETEQSAVGHGVSLHRPLRVAKERERFYRVDGTPADCVLLAIRHILERRPDLVVSGINYGANLGDDITYSGTVAGAFEGMLHGVPSMAVSNVSSEARHMDTAARATVLIARHVLAKGLPKDTMLNVNVPDLPHDEIAGIAVTRMGETAYHDEIIKRTDPRGGDYYWIGGAAPSGVPQPGTDYEAIGRRQVSVTPIQRNLTNLEAIDTLGAHEIAW